MVWFNKSLPQDSSLITQAIDIIINKIISCFKWWVVARLMMNKRDDLNRIYEKFRLETESYRLEAACAKGCAFCCTDAGSIDIITLEGLVIRRFVMKLPRARRAGINKALKRDFAKREKGRVVPCPFLMKSKACLIYDIRPFACRRIYSLHTCSNDRPPRLSRQFMALAQKTIASLQHLDVHGYSGHLSFILRMLDSDRFRETYLSDGFKPEQIMAFGKTHRILINKMAVTTPSHL